MIYSSWLHSLKVFASLTNKILIAFLIKMIDITLVFRGVDVGLITLVRSSTRNTPPGPKSLTSKTGLGGRHAAATHRLLGSLRP